MSLDNVYNDELYNRRLVLRGAYEECKVALSDASYRFNTSKAFDGGFDWLIEDEKNLAEVEKLLLEAERKWEVLKNAYRVNQQLEINYEAVEQ